MTLRETKLIEVVDPVRGNSRYTKDYGEKNRGEFPVYSASNSVPLTFINHYDYDGEFLSWTTNGFGGFLRIIKGKFSINGDRGILTLKPGVKVSIEFLRYALQPVLRSLAKGRKGDRGKNEFTKVPLAAIKKVLISIPVDQKGGYDVEAQAKLVKKYQTVESLQSYLSSEAIDLRETALDIPLTGRSLTLRVEEIFDLDEQTNSSTFTRQFVDQHKGSIPVYSASKDENSEGYGRVADNLPEVKYFEDILTWNIDGSVGKAFFREGRFTLSEKVIPLRLHKKWEGLLDYHFLKYLLEEKAVENGFGFSNKAGKVRIKDIEIQIPEMLNNAGVSTPDIKEQRRLAEKYAEIYALKADFISQLEDLKVLSVSVN